LCATAPETVNRGELCAAQLSTMGLISRQEAPSESSALQDLVHRLLQKPGNTIPRKFCSNTYTSRPDLILSLHTYFKVDKHSTPKTPFLLSSDQ